MKSITKPYEQVLKVKKTGSKGINEFLSRFGSGF